MNEIIKIDRCGHPQCGPVGDGLLLGFSLTPRMFGEETGAAAERRQAGSFTPDAFIRIDADDTVTLTIPKSEMGQGVYTALPMLVAEELACDWQKIRVEAAPVRPAYNHTEWGPLQGTGGSSSVSSEWERLRKAGATAREMLLAAAAATWNVGKEVCSAEAGRVVHASGKTLTFGELAKKAGEMPVPEDVPLKAPSLFRIIGKPTLRLDTPEKVDGRAVFGLDARLPGMLTAVIARCPVFGGRVKSVDAARAKAFPGVRDVFTVPSGVAVLADAFWPAKKGRDLLNIVWDEGEGAGLSTSALRARYQALVRTPGMTARLDGDPDGSLGGASQRIAAEYEVPYLAHAMMEPLNCLVDYRGDHCEIWTGTQFQTVDRDAAARVLNLDPGQVEIHTTFLGGGFGRRANPASDFVVEAAHVAKAVKKPVMVVWTREDDIKGGYYRPFWYDRLEAGLDAAGNPVSWKHAIAGQSILKDTVFSGMIVDGLDAVSVEGAKELPYAVPNVYVGLHSPEVPVPVQWWRSVGHSHTAFVVESFIDELAHLAGKDPYEFRRGLLSAHPRLRRVLETAAQEAGWDRPLPAGQGRGIAVHESFGSYVAQVAEVSVSEAGKVRVHRVVCAVDCGLAVNPGTIRAQVEGSVVFGLTAALYGAITLKDGRVEQDNFRNYPMLRMNEMPVVEVHIVPSGEAPSGIGEPGVPPIAPAVTNAVFALTGKRVRTLPIRPDELKVESSGMNSSATPAH
ncbi:MAG: xanthine dehydrogenase family protein molybdopterin-binding subunit [Deltaproteobacteria bacterium]|nr:xanthine dehydrogenase family protein molybdopterin-binding subunit [Deltaproteobacteria bacterium]